MINTDQLKPNDTPKRYVGMHPQTGEEILSSDVFKKSDDAAYVGVLAKYVDLVGRIRQAGQETVSGTQMREIIIEQARAKKVLEQIERKVAGLEEDVRARTALLAELELERSRTVLTAGQRDVLQKIIPCLQKYVSATRATGELQRQILRNQKEVSLEKFAMHTLLESAVTAIVSRKALDKAVVDLQKKRRAYKNLVRDYEEATAVQERILSNPKAPRAKAAQALVDELDLDGRGIYIPKPVPSARAR